MADTNTWTPIDDPTAFQDDAVFEIDKTTKSIQVLVEQPIVAGENKSQFIKFQMGRYYDAIDLTQMEVNILYESPAGNGGISSAVNREYSDEYIRFGWLVPYAACPEKGTLSFAVEFVGEDYALKTTRGSTPVLDSISGSSYVPEPVEQNWYIELQSQVASTLQTASDALEKSKQIINALATPQNASLASEMSDTSAVYVYTGSESGYTYGNWYYYDGTEWVSGGKYASTALVTDRTLSQGGQAADAEITGYVKDDTRKNTDYVRDLQKEINGAYDLDLQWEQGNLNYSGAVNNVNIIRTSNYFETSRLTGITAEVESGYKVTIVKYKGNTDPKTEILGYITIADGETVIPDGTYSYFRVKMEPNPSAAILPSSGRKLRLKATVNTSTIARIENLESQMETSLIEQVHTNATGPMVEIAETYFNVAYDPNDQIIYNTHRGLFAPETETEDGKKAIVCSQFATACFSATPYEYSRYVKDNNQSLWWGLHTDGTGNYAYEDYMIAKEIARYCQSQGWLHAFNVEHNDMKTGDLIFYSSDNTVDNVGHVAIALVVGTSKYILMESSANMTRLVDNASVGVSLRTFSYSRVPPAFYAHIPVMPSEYMTKLLVQDENSYSETIDSGTVRMKLYSLATYLNRGFYSFSCDYSGDGYPYLKITYEDNQSENFSHDEVNAGKYNLVFYAQMPIKSIDVRCVGEGIHTVNNISIRKGFYLYS